MLRIEEIRETHATMKMLDLERELQQRSAAIDVIRAEMAEIKPLLDPKYVEHQRQLMLLDDPKLHQGIGHKQ